MAAAKADRGIGARIRAARKTAGLTQAELAETVGVEPESINRIENAKLSPARETLQKIASALGAKLGALLEDTTPLQVAKPALTPARRRLLRLVDGLDEDQIEVLVR